MSHKYESSAVLCCCIQTVIICRFYCLCRDCFCNGLFVLVDYGSVTSNLAKQRLCDGYGLKFIFIAIYCFFQLVVLCAVHQMSRLNNQFFHAIAYSSFQCLIYVVDLLVIAGLYMVDDDLCSEGTSYGPVRICSLQSFLNASDILSTAVVEGSTKAYNQKLILADLVSV